MNPRSTNPNHPPADHQAASRCPPLLALAAYADGRLTDEAEQEALLVHASMCSSCAALLHGLQQEASEVEREGALLIAPASVVAAAMSLRSMSSGPMISSNASWWMTAMRRSAALAACAALAFAGYHVGRTFAMPSAAVLSSDALAFGLLDNHISDADADFDLLSLAVAHLDLSESQP